jgi:hypothetical protein
MNRRSFLKAVPAVAGLAAAASAADKDAKAAALEPINLTKPETEGGKSVLAALKERRTIREISSRALPPQMLSNLLWAAWGVNRKKGPFGMIGRTAASASNSQEIDLYVAMPEGAYLYDAAAHRLVPVTGADLRPLCGNRGRRPGVDAPVRLIFVADLEKYNHSGFDEPGLHDPEVQRSYYNVAIGLIAGNVHLFAAAHDLAAWFHNCDKAALAEALKLGSDQRVVYSQTVGYPA